MIQLNDTNSTVIFRPKAVTYIKKVPAPRPQRTETVDDRGLLRLDPGLARDYIVVHASPSGCEYLYYENQETLLRDYANLIAYISAAT